MIIAITLTILAVLCAVGYNLYTCWREQQSYTEYRKDFRRELRAHVDDASLYVPAPSKTWMS